LKRSSRYFSGSLAVVGEWDLIQRRLKPNDMNHPEATVAKDERLIESLTRLEPVFLLECAQGLAASARYLKNLRQAKDELRPADAEYVAGHISRAMTRAMQHLDERVGY
jgi:hypothetical protein